MGRIIRYTHSDCNFQFEFREGGGFHMFELQCKAREKMRSGQWGDHWKEMMERYPEGTATLSNALCFCPKCRKIFTEPRIHFYIPQEGFHFEYDEVHSDMIPAYVIFEHYQLIEKDDIQCPDCEISSQVFEDTRRINCPVCGKKLNGKAVGHWD